MFLGASGGKNTIAVGSYGGTSYSDMTGLINKTATKGITAATRVPFIFFIIYFVAH